MNTSVFTRVLWKEYRTIRDFWIAAAVGVICIQAIAIYFDSPSAGLQACLMIGLAVASFFSLGVGAVIGASDGEERTDELYVHWGAPPAAVLSAKLASGVSAILILLLLAAVSGLVICWDSARGVAQHRFHQPVELVSVHLLLLLILPFCAGWLSGILSRRTLVAVCLGAALSVLSFLQDIIWRELQLVQQDKNETSYLVLWILASVTLTSCVVLGRRRLLGESLWPTRLAGLGSRAGWAPNKVHLAASALRSNSEFLRLVWMEQRRARWWGAALVAGCAGIAFYNFPPGRSQEAVLGSPTALGLYTAGFAAGLLGVLSMRDWGAETRFSFFSERGASAGNVWLSRVVVWFSCAIVTIGATVAASATSVVVVNRMSGKSMSAWNFDYARSFGVALLGAFWMGCLASIVFASTVTSLFMAWLFMVPLILWLALLDWSHAPAAIFATPVVLIVVAATFVRLQDVLRGPVGWRANGRLAMTLLLPLLPLLVGFEVFRAVQIPAVRMHVQERNPAQESSVWDPTGEEKETASLYAEALASMSTSDRTGFGREHLFAFNEYQREWLERNAKAFELTLKASRRDGCALVNPLTLSPAELSSHKSELQPLVGLLLCNARKLEFEGKLDDAMGIYIAAWRVGMHVAQNGPPSSWLQGSEIQRVVLRWLPDWMTHPKQTPLRLMQMRSQLIGAITEFPRMAAAMEVAYYASRYYVDRGWAWTADHSKFHPEASANPSFPQWHRDRQFYPSLYPERLRAFRLIDQSFARIIYPFQVWDQAARRGPLTEAPQPEHCTIEPAKDENRWMHSTAGAWEFQSCTSMAKTDAMIRRLLDFRLAVVQTAIYAWKIENKALPDRLDQLIGKQLDEMPVDPFSGNPFIFFPKGLKHPFVDANNPVIERVGGGKPFLWIDGSASLRLALASKDGVVHYEIYSPSNGANYDAKALNLADHLCPIRPSYPWEK